jgi:hypothetical protein
MSQETKTSLQNTVDTNIADNVNREISEQDVRDVFTDLIDSTVFIDGSPTTEQVAVWTSDGTLSGSPMTFNGNLGVGGKITNISNGDSSQDAVNYGQLISASAHALDLAPSNASDIGLGNVDNTSDANKPISNATQTALNGKLDKTGGDLSGDLNLNGNYLEDPRIIGGILESNLEAFNQKIVGLGNGTNAQDAVNYGQLISASAHALELAPSNASDIGLGNVDNTSDLDKPISNATQTALNGKLDKTGGDLSGDLNLNGNYLEDPRIIGGILESNLEAFNQKIVGLGNGTNTQDAVNYGQLISASAHALDLAPSNASDIGLGNVDNTSDLDKPISIATQAALASISSVSAIVPDHNNLNGLQGGGSGQYYHLTQGQLVDLQSTSSSPLHNDLIDLQGGSFGNYFHLTQEELIDLRSTSSTPIQGHNGGFDADTVDGYHRWDLLNADNILSGTLPDERIQSTSVTQHQSLLSHNSLSSLQGGDVNQYYHLTSQQISDLFGASANPLHNDLNGLQGGESGEYYHLSLNQLTSLLASSATPDHNDTGNIQGGDIDDYYHLTSQELTNLRGVSANATLNNDADVSTNSWVLDEDDMSSNDDTKVPTQQSVKAYVDSTGGYQTHNSLSAIQGGTDEEYYHLTNYERNVLYTTSATPDHNDTGNLQGGTVGEYYHLTEQQRTDLMSASATPDHNQLVGLQGGAADNYYHLTSQQMMDLFSTSGSSVGGAFLPTSGGNLTGVVDFGGFTLQNIGDGSTASHGVNYGQLIAASAHAASQGGGGGSSVPTKKVLEFYVHNPNGISIGDGVTHQFTEYGGSIDSWIISGRDSNGDLVNNTLSADLLVRDWVGSSYEEPVFSIQNGGVLPSISSGATSNYRLTSPGLSAIPQGGIIRCESLAADASVATMVVTLEITPS